MRDTGQLPVEFDFAVGSGIRSGASGIIPDTKQQCKSRPSVGRMGRGLAWRWLIEYTALAGSLALLVRRPSLGAPTSVWVSHYLDTNGLSIQLARNRT